MAAERSGRVWDEVRRALGRLAGRVASHDVPEAQSGIPVLVRHTEVLDFAEAEAGARQAECQPLSQVRRLPSPHAGAGHGGVDLAAVATVIGENRAIGASEATLRVVPFRFEDIPVHTWGMQGGLSEAPSVCAATAQFVAPPVQTPSVILTVPSIQGLPVVHTTMPQSKRDSGATWQFGATRVRTGLPLILRAPITCARVQAPPGAASSVVFAAERLLLADATGIPEADVALIGVFPHVPLGAVQKLAVVPDGTALQIWVKPDAAKGHVPVSTVTVVLGRQRSTGKMLQSVRRVPNNKTRL